MGAVVEKVPMMNGKFELVRLARPQQLSYAERITDEQLNNNAISFLVDGSRNSNTSKG